MTNVGVIFLLTFDVT